MSVFINLLNQTTGESFVNSIVDITLQRPELLDELWEYAITDAHDAWKALWVMDKIHDTRPDLIQPYLKQMYENVVKLKQSGQKRSILKLLSLNPLPVEPTGRFIDYCFSLLKSKSEPVSGRVYAMQILYNITKTIPDFKHELRIVIEDAMIEGSPGIKSRGRKLLRRL
jgi:hypothetical protein